MKLLQFFNVPVLEIIDIRKDLMVAMLFAIVIMFNVNVYGNNHIHPMFPFGDTNASTSCHLQFVSIYPSGALPVGMRTSPYAHNDSGISVSPYFYVIPTVHLSEALSDNFLMQLYSVPSVLFFDDATNWIIIAPTEPFSYNTSYSVVFNNFPLWEPNTSVDSGYTTVLVDTIFVDYIKIINYPVSITDISFQTTGNVIWNANDNIVVYFNDSISPNLSILDSMFSVIMVDGSVVDSNGSLNYNLISVITSASLSSDGKSVVLTHTDPFAPGSYFLRVDLDYYLGDDFFNTSYSFDVLGYTEEFGGSRIIVDIKSHFPDSLLSGEFKYKGYDGQKVYYYGDTLRVGFPAIYKDYYLSSWQLPETTDGTLYRYGELLEIILDTANYFSNSFENPVFNEIKKTGITIDVYYTENPLDTLRIDLIMDDNLVTQFPDYTKYLLVTGTEEKINDLTYTFRRYSHDSIRISYNYSGVFYLDSSTVSELSTLSMIPTNLNIAITPIIIPPYFVLPPSPTSLLAIPVLPGLTNSRDTVIIIDPPLFDIDIEKQVFCETGSIKVEINYMGYGIERAFEDNLANITNMISEIVIYCRVTGAKYPQFDTTTSRCKESQSVQVYSNPPSSSPINAGYSVALSHPDYEIFLVTTKYGPNKCGVTDTIVKKGDYGHSYRWEIEQENSNYNDYITGEYIYTDYKLPGANAITGWIETRNDKGCANTLKIYIRRKIVEFAFDVMNTKPKNNGIGVDLLRVPNLAYFRFMFEELLPVNTLNNKKYLPKSNYTDVNDIKNYGCYVCWGSFIGIDKPIADFSYHRRECKISMGHAADSNSREDVLKECVSVFYYSGESFSYKPFLKENCGYKFKKMTMPTNSAYSQENETDTTEIKINNFQSPDSILSEAKTGFILEYIQVPKLRGNDTSILGGSEWCYKMYAVDDYGYTEYDYPIWRDGMLDDYDNGLYLNEEYNRVSNNLHTHTVRLAFHFNKDVADFNNVNIYDVPDDYYSLKDSLRPDSNKFANYPMIFDGWGGTGGNTWRDGSTSRYVVRLVNGNITPNKNTTHKMCNLQKFNIEIINTKDNPILAYDLWGDSVLNDTLCNVVGTSLRPTIFKASTIPPALSTRLHCFGNIDLKDDRFLHDILIEPYIHLFTEYNLTDETNYYMEPVFDSLGKIEFNLNMKRYPSGKNSYKLAKDKTKIIDYDFNDITVLRDKQRILHLFCWARENNFIGRACGKTFDILGAFGKFFLKAKDITGLDDVVDTAVSILKKSICSGDKYLGTNNFWLTKTGNSINKNNGWQYVPGYYLSLDESEVNEWFKTKLKQDWNIWGCGTYGMYNDWKKLFAYNSIFNFIKAERDCGPGYIDEGFYYQPFKVIFSGAMPNFYTVIKVITGDRP